MSQLFSSPTWDIVSSDTGKKAFVGDFIDQEQEEFRFAGDMMDNLFQTQQLSKQAEAYREAAQNGGGGGGGGGQSSGGGGLGSTIGAGAGLAAGMLIPGAQPFVGPLMGLGSSIGGLFG